MCTGLLLHGKEIEKSTCFSELLVSLEVLMRCFFVYLGFLLGWLCVPDQPYPPPCPGPDAHRTILPPHLRGLLHSLLPGHHPLHADLFCWFPGKVKKHC